MLITMLPKIEVSGSGNLTLNGTTTTSDLDLLDGGILSLPDINNELTVTGLFNWKDGGMKGDGKFMLEREYKYS